MSDGRDEGPVYYREIQKNAYLKRIPNDAGSKLRPLGHKKPALKPMWTLFCVHNGRTPFLEQYPGAESLAALAHRPVWRACLLTARHVTAGVRPRGDEYDFLVDTDHGPVRMLAPDWESMQDWVSTLRNKLSELRITGRGENVYCAAPAPPPPPAPRAPARDPTSPLPPTPPVPPDRVPGIELIPPRAVEPPEDTNQPTPSTTESENIDISNWDTELTTPSTSQNIEPKSVTKICGQNICVDDSMLKRNATDSDEEFFTEIDRLHEDLEGSATNGQFKQRLVVDGERRRSIGEGGSESQSTNITVIQVSNKPPHTAIPVLGPETDIFDFEFKQKVTLSPQQPTDFVNIVNTETNAQNSTENGYGTVYCNEDSEYGHISLTTTVSLTGDVKNDGVYERLCMASTSDAADKSDSFSPMPLRKLQEIDKVGKGSLPNLGDAESYYGYLFPNASPKRGILCPSQSKLGQNQINLSHKLSNQVTNTRLNVEEVNSNSLSISNHSSEARNANVLDGSRNKEGRSVTEDRSNVSAESRNVSTESSDNGERSAHTNVSNSVTLGIVDFNTRALRVNVERSHSQNACDSTPRLRENIVRRVQNNSPKRDGKDKPEATKPIWKRGLTELSLLTKLRGMGQKRHESPTRRDGDIDRTVTAPGVVVRRSRPEGRPDGARRRSSSLTNGQANRSALQPLRARQAACLRADQRRGAAVHATVPTREPPLFVDYDKQVWVARWGWCSGRGGGRAGDRVAALRGTAPRDAHHARLLLKGSHTAQIDILFHRVPLGKMFVLNKRDLETIGIKLDNECNITSVVGESPAGRAGLPPGRWAVTEVNNRPINLVKGGEEEMNRLSVHGTEVSILIQPSALVKKLRAAVKASKPLLGLR